MDAPLPPYSPERSQATDRIEHNYVLKSGKSNGDAWATLNVFSKARSPSSMPLFYEGDQIEGSLDLNLKKSDTFQDITLFLLGKLSTGSLNNETIVFYTDSLTTWSKSASDSTNASGKLKGPYSWPFKFTLPKSTTFQGIEYMLPETFMERRTTVGVRYELRANFTRGRFKTNDYLNTSLSYVPRITPPPLTALRCIAYENDLALPEPEADPTGWERLESVVLPGTNTSNPVQDEINVTLWIAKPLSYTRGTVIPCLLDIECKNQERSNLAAGGYLLSVRLQRTIQYAPALSGLPGGNFNKGTKEEIDYPESAVFWPSPTRTNSNPSTRRVDGEIRLSQDLKPTSALAHFSINYAVAILPTKVARLGPEQLTSPFHTRKIEIVTSYARGPRPKPYSPPGYEAPKVEYISENFLEIGKGGKFYNDW